MAKNSTKIGTNLKFIGGVNKDRIGGNCSIIEHTDETGNTTRVMEFLAQILNGSTLIFLYSGFITFIGVSIEITGFSVVKAYS